MLIVGHIKSVRIKGAREVRVLWPLPYEHVFLHDLLKLDQQEVHLLDRLAQKEMLGAELFDEALGHLPAIIVDTKTLVYELQSCFGAFLIVVDERDVGAYETTLSDKLGLGRKERLTLLL